jgi:hypothetical protein
MDAQFKSSFRFALYGSTLYELIALAHRTFIFHKLDLSSYGLLVSILGISSIAVHIGDFGASNTLSPFMHIFCASKQNFKTMLLRYTMRVHLPLMLLASAGTLFFWHAKLPGLSNSSYVWLLGVLILLEIPEAFMRQFLYAAAQTRFAVTCELALLIARLALLWMLIMFFGWSLTVGLILLSHVISAFVCCFIFMVALARLYRTLPDVDRSIPNMLPRSLARTRFFNYVLRLSRNIFTSSSLTPIFALIFDLKTAGIFYFAGKLVKVVQSVVRIAIGYTGNGLLARVKNQGIGAKQEAFQILGEHLMRILLPVLMCFALNSSLLERFGYVHQCSHEMVVFTQLFLIVNFFDCVVLLYEQYYIMEEASARFFFLKVFEIAALCGIMQLHGGVLVLLASLIATKIISFLVVGFDAYACWGIRPTFRISYRYAGSCALFALACLLILK